MQSFPAGSGQGCVIQRLDIWQRLGRKTQLKTYSSRADIPTSHGADACCSQRGSCSQRRLRSPFPLSCWGGGRGEQNPTTPAAAWASPAQGTPPSPSPTRLRVTKVRVHPRASSLPGRGALSPTHVGAPSKDEGLNLKTTFKSQSPQRIPWQRLGMRPEEPESQILPPRSRGPAPPWSPRLSAPTCKWETESGNEAAATPGESGTARAQRGISEPLPAPPSGSAQVLGAHPRVWGSALGSCLRLGEAPHGQV